MSTPKETLSEAESLAIAGGLVDYLIKEAKLEPEQIVGVLEYVAGFHDNEVRKTASLSFGEEFCKEAGVIDWAKDKWNKATGALTGATAGARVGWNHPDSTKTVVKAYNSGNWAPAIRDFGNRIVNSDTFKTWAPRIAGGLLSYGAARLMGAGKGTALAAGLAGGAALPHVYNAYKPEIDGAIGGVVDTVKSVGSTIGDLISPSDQKEKMDQTRATADQISSQLRD